MKRWLRKIVYFLLIEILEELGIIEIDESGEVRKSPGTQ